MFYSKESGLEGKKEIVVLERNYASIKWDKREINNVLSAPWDGPFHDSYIIRKMVL